MRTVDVRAFVAAVVLLLGGMMLQSQAARAGAAGVSIQNIQYAPAAMTLTAGDAVTSTNHDPTTHSVRWTGGRTDAGPFLSQGQTYTTSFAAPGSYTYVCGVHPSMMGSVTVMAVPTPTHSPAPPPTPASSTPRPTTRPTPSPTQQPTARSSPTESQAPTTISFAPAISSTPATVVEIATSSPATTVPAPVAAAPPAPPSA